MAAQNILIDDHRSLPGFRSIPVNNNHITTALDPNIFAVKDLAYSYTAKMNVIRFIAILSIVWCHSLNVWDSLTFHTYTGKLLQMGIIQLGRIGTICFFIISGYFLADKLATYTVASYLKHRFRSIILPWLSTMVIFTIIQSAKEYTQLPPQEQAMLPVAFMAAAYFKSFIFHAAYWFVPVSLLSASIMIVCYKHVNKLWFGFLLASLTLFHGINLHFEWVSAEHTKAVLGYVFFLWLGMQLKYNLPLLHQWISGFSWSMIVLITIAAFMIACVEGLILKHNGSPDPYASIRISNAALSIIVFIALLKTNKADRLNKFEPQKFVYGVYLLHSIVVSQIDGAFNILWHKVHAIYVVPDMIVLQIAYVGIILLITYGLVIILKRSALKWMIGQ